MIRFENLGNKFVSQNGNKDIKYLQDKKIVALFFGAKWCVPSVRFIPSLLDFYRDANKETANNLEIVYVSNDNTEKDYQQQVDSFPWLAFPYKDQSRINTLLQYKKIVPGMPCLVILNSDGSVCWNRGRGDVELKGNSSLFEWMKKVDQS